MKLFTSEAVSTGHPDVLADNISDSILDAYLKKDPSARCAVEVLVKDHLVTIGGEISSTAYMPRDEIENIIKEVISRTGYKYEPHIILELKEQSPDIALGTNDEVNGAGDQGLMFGYATNEGPNYMPLAIHIAHSLITHAEYLKDKVEEYSWIKPDMKSQVTLDYDTVKPTVKTVVFSIQHEEGIDYDEMRASIKHLVDEVLGIYSDHIIIPEEYELLFNPTGKFVIGGPFGDAGVTGRKIVVDSYGGYAPVGGGTMRAGKDSTKVDRSAAYMTRYLAKNIVASGLMKDCLIQLSYAIGVSQPVSLNISTKDIDIKESQLRELESIIMNKYDLSPSGIIKFLDLKRPLYTSWHKNGAFTSPTKEYWSVLNTKNKEEIVDVPWEQIDENFLK